MEAMLADGYLLTSSDSDGALLNKTQYINGAMNPNILHTDGFEFLELSAQPLGDDVAIVRSRLDWRSTYRGKPWNAAFLMSDIWQREGDVWRLVSRHSSYPASALPEIVKQRYGGN
jgi:hypothetical protein